MPLLSMVIEATLEVLWLVFPTSIYIPGLRPLNADYRACFTSTVDQMSSLAFFVKNKFGLYSVVIAFN